MKVEDVAKYFLALQHADPEGSRDITNMKLQKLLYYAQGYHLALYGRPLFDAPIEAWTHGPVVPRVYREYKAYGSDPIPFPDDGLPDVPDEQTRDFLDEVYNTVGQFSAWKLRQMTHEEPPWRDADAAGGDSPEISHDAMRRYFETLVN